MSDFIFKLFSFKMWLSLAMLSFPPGLGDSSDYTKHNAEGTERGNAHGTSISFLSNNSEVNILLWERKFEGYPRLGKSALNWTEESDTLISFSMSVSLNIIDQQIALENGFTNVCLENSYP